MTASKVTRESFEELHAQLQADADASLPRQRMTKFEVIEKLVPSIQKWRADGHTMAHIADLLSHRGVSVHYKTLEKYLRQVASNKPKRRSVAKQGATQKAPLSPPTKPATAPAPAPGNARPRPRQTPAPAPEAPALNYRPAKSTWVSPRKAAPDADKPQKRADNPDRKRPLLSRFEIPDEVPLDKL